jgi:ribosome biogenesis GTPase A
MKKKTIVVGLAGNPNSGKTSIFNALTGANIKNILLKSSIFRVHTVLARIVLKKLWRVILL